MIAAALGFVIRHETLVGWAAVLAGAGLLGGLAAHRLEAPRLARAQAAAAEARAQAASSAAAARMTTAASAAVETARTREAAVTPIAQEAADAVVQAPGADAPVPPDVLRDWGAGLDRLRDEARAARGAPPDPGGAGAARPVPPA